MGRRVFVRWDLTVGPDNRDMVVALPREAQISTGELRPTISQVRSLSLTRLKKAMNEASNWVGLLTHFDYERALSGYVAAYPHRLEDGLLPHPNERIRERVFGDRSRLDVLLTDRTNVPVVVECKQGGPTVSHLKQIRAYMRRLKSETGVSPRGILIHGGARKLSRDVAAEAQKYPTIEIVQYTLEVDFAGCA
jgi:RecB family endonuclease NucS